MSSVFIRRGESQYGPYERAEVRQFFVEGRLHAADWAWEDGMPTWVPLPQLLNDASSGNGPPPMSAPPPFPASVESYNSESHGLGVARKSLLAQKVEDDSLIGACTAFGIVGILLPWIQLSGPSATITKLGISTTLGELAMACLIARLMLRTYPRFSKWNWTAFVAADALAVVTLQGYFHSESLLSANEVNLYAEPRVGIYLTIAACTIGAAASFLQRKARH